MLDCAVQQESRKEVLDELDNLEKKIEIHMRTFDELSARLSKVVKVAVDDEKKDNFGVGVEVCELADKIRIRRYVIEFITSRMNNLLRDLQI